MDGAPSVYIFIILAALIVLSMLFSISESSFRGMNKLRLRILRKNKDKRALIAGRLLDRRERLINSLLVSNDIVNCLGPYDAQLHGILGVQFLKDNNCVIDFANKTIKIGD